MNQILDVTQYIDVTQDIDVTQNEIIFTNRRMKLYLNKTEEE